MVQSQILIAGAGPTGLAAALFLARRGLRPRIVDAADAPAQTSRALAVNPRSLELLEATGITADILDEGRRLGYLRFYHEWRPIARLSLREVHPKYGMTVIPQARTEALLAEALAREGVTVERGVTVAGVSQTADVVNVELIHPGGAVERTSAEILYAADGAHSRVRHCLGLAFDGTFFPEEWPLRDMELEVPLSLECGHASFAPEGLIFVLALEPGLWRVFGNVRDPVGHLPPGTRVGATVWESRFHIAHRVAAATSVGRVALGGDAAHIHSPIGARGMNLGIEDAYVFAACAAEAVSGRLDRLKDYGRLRHPVHRDVVDRVERLTRLARGGTATMRLLRRRLLPVLTRLPPTAGAMLRTVTGLDHDLQVD